jgi:hypothetical protein
MLYLLFVLYLKYKRENNLRKNVLSFKKRVFMLNNPEDNRIFYIVNTTFRAKIIIIIDFIKIS